MLALGNSSWETAVLLAAKVLSPKTWFNGKSELFSQGLLLHLGLSLWKVKIHGLYLPLCKSGLSPLKSADVKIWVNKGRSRPGAVIPSLLLLFRLGFQICNCNIIFPVIWECGLSLSWNKRMNRHRLALQSCSMVPRQVVVAGFRLPCHSEWSLSAQLQNSLFCYFIPLKQQ